MSVQVVISSTGHRRIHCAQRWLENRAAAEEVLIVGATLDAANELARKVVKKKGAEIFARASADPGASRLAPVARWRSWTWRAGSSQG
jgi:hypothetical protein